MSDKLEDFKNRILQEGLGSLNWEYSPSKWKARAELSFKVYLRARFDPEDGEIEFSVYDGHDALGDKESNWRFASCLKFLEYNAGEAQAHAHDLSEAHKVLSELLSKRAPEEEDE
jgi:hypothetical protein